MDNSQCKECGEETTTKIKKFRHNDRLVYPYNNRMCVCSVRVHCFVIYAGKVCSVYLHFPPFYPKMCVKKWVSPLFCDLCRKSLFGVSSFPIFIWLMCAIFMWFKLNHMETIWNSLESKFSYCLSVLRENCNWFWY